MKTRTTRGGLRLTEVGLGTSQLGNLYTETSDEDAAEVISTAWRGGVRYFDTAPHYGLGLSERRLGSLLQPYPRDEYVLSTKVGRLLTPHVGGAGKQDTEGFAVPATHVRQWDLSRDGIRRSIEESLIRLGLDRIDIAYLHDPDGREEEAIRTALPALIELRDEGILRAVGAGMNHAPPLTRFVKETDIDIVMVAGKLTLLDKSAADELVPAAMEHGVSIVAAGVYNSGILATRRPKADARFDYVQADQELISLACEMADVCEANGVELPAAALQFPLGQPAVASVVVGARNGAQVSSALDRYKTEIPERLWRMLAGKDLARR
ncbi:aldo/keto reductase [Arthrobacter sp. D1-17]